MTHQPVRTEVDGDVWRVSLDSPGTGNAVDPAMAAALGKALHIRPPGTRAVLLLAEGERFCVGGDVRGFAAAGDPGTEVGRLAADWHEVVRALLATPVPVVAGPDRALLRALGALRATANSSGVREPPLKAEQPLVATAATIRTAETALRMVLYLLRA